MTSTLLDRMPTPDADGRVDDDAVYLAFTEWAESRGLPLYPAQDEALTVRATRSALAKLDVDASRILN